MAELDLIQATLAGTAGAWPLLQAAIEPTIRSIARGHRSMRAKGLASLPDDVAEVVTSTLERLARDDFQNLRRFVERARESEQAGSFDSWLYGTVDFVVREHLRRRFGRAPRPQDAARSPQPSKRDLQSHAGRLDDGLLERMLISELGVTTRLTVAQIFEHIERDFRPDEARALRLYFHEDASFEQIAEALSMGSAKQAEMLVRRLNARLRYRFLNAGPQ